jgi:tetratricopeptide (TPR) repeat protein
MLAKRISPLVLMPALAYAQAPGAAPAQDAKATEAQRAKAKERYEQGVEAYKNNRFKDAVDWFLEADRLAPSAPLSFNIARAYSNLGDDAGALRWYRDYLRRAPGAANASEVQALVRSLEGAMVKKGVQQVTVLSVPDGATVTIDDRPRGVTPWTGELAPGKHSLALSMKGFIDSEGTFNLPAERAIDVSVALVRAAETRPEPAPPSSGAAQPSATISAPAAAPVQPAPEREQGSSGFGIWPWVSIGVGVAALGGALAFEMSRRSAETDAEKDPTQLGYQEKFETMQSRQTTARVLGIAGGVFLVTGGVLMALDLSSSRATVSAGCGPGTCGLSAAGRF